MSNNIPITLSNQKIKQLLDLYCKITKQQQKQVLLPMIYDIHNQFEKEKSKSRYERLG